MADEGFKRKLTAILSADVEGYSRLMDDDDEATVRTLTTYRSVVTDLVQQYRGRVVDSPGDNILAEFKSVVDAVNCAVEIQRDLAERNAELSYSRQMQFRIGVNLGDVIDEDGRIYGDGVNIAARVESLAEAGGICISGRAHDQVENKLGLEYEDLGKHEVKNISRPIQVYRLLSFPGAAAHRVVQAKKALGRRWLKIGLTATFAVVVVAALGIWQFYMRRPAVEPASVKNMALPLPEKPSIAVLPFVNMSDDPEQEYFSDGITEDIITALSKTPKMLVIARNSTFSYKGKAVKIKEIAEDLGVQYVLEGSVRKAGDRIRINAQLIDSISGHHVWAERYDRDLKDVFALQDEITIKIISALKVNLTDGEIAHISAMKTQNLEAYLKAMKAREYFLHFNERDNTLAQGLAEEAIAMDSEYSYPYILLAWTHYMDIYFRASKSPKQSMLNAFEFAQKALSIDLSLAPAHILLSYIYLFKRQYEKGIAEAKKAVEINPNYADGYSHIARHLHYVGRNEEAIELIKKAMRLNPFPPSFYYYQLGYCYFTIDQYEAAIEEFKKAIDLEPKNQPALVGLSASYSSLNRTEEALSAGKDLCKIAPNFSVKSWVKKLPYKSEADSERITKSLYKAGLPE